MKNLIACLLGLVLLVAVNLFASAGLRGIRLDLTEEKLFTLAEGSKSIVRDLDEPVKLSFYFSESMLGEFQDVKNLGNRVREVLEEFALASNGDLQLEVIDPEPYSEDEERAEAEGLYGLALPSGDRVFLGLVGSNSTDDRETIPVFNPTDPRIERFLEYDVASMIRSLAHPEKQVVGILSSLPIGGGPPNPMTGQPGAPRWRFVDEIGSLFEARELEATATRIPAEVNMLVVVHPKNLGEQTLYAIDQFVLSGKKAIVYVDAHCDADQTGVDPSNPMSAMTAPKNSDLEPLFEKWGVELIKSKVVGDRQAAMTVTYGSATDPRQTPYVAWLDLREDNLDEEDAVTSLLTNLMIVTPGVLQEREEKTTTVTPLVTTSEDSMLLDVGTLQFRPDPEQMLQNFVAEHTPRTLAARISGEVESAFPDGPPAPIDPAESDEDVAPHLASSEGPISVIVVSDVDQLVDRTWIREERLFGQISIGWRKTSNNGDFLLNALENFAGGDELISIRARGKFSRPFDRVDEIRLAADEKYASEKRDLERKLTEIDQRIGELQQEKSPDSMLILSPEQQDQWDKAQEEKLATKRKLREVRLNLRKDVESLGTRLKLINIAGIPAFVAILAVVLGLWRISRRGS